MILKTTRLFVSALVIIAFSVSTFAQNGLTPAQVAKTQSVGSVYMSSNAEHVVYSVSVPADPFKENRAASSHLYHLDVKSGVTKPLITDMSVGGVTFRPNHNTISYLAKKNGDATRSLYEMDLESGSSKKLYAFSSNISGYSWASDGSHIVFRAPKPIEKTESPLPYQPEIYEENLPETWAYIQNVIKDGHMPHKIPVEGNVYSAKWSPDFSKIAMGIAPTSLVDDSFMGQKIKIVDHKTREILAEVDHVGKLGAYTWSPDSKKLALIAAANINDPIDGRVKIIDAATGAATIIQPDFKGKFEQISWKDNNSLYYLVSKGVYSEFGTINSDGKKMKALFSDKNLNLKAFAISENGTVAFDANSPSHPDELYLMKNKEKAPKRITDSNPWLADVALGKQEVVTYTTKDGFEIEGLLIYPLGYKKGTKYPLINVVHGGPEAHYDNGWLTAYSMPGQVAAAQGYAVFYLNYRGSTGRGLEFAMSSQGDLAGAEFDDIVEGVDYLIEAGIADGEKVGVTGGSYGGYATAWMSTKYSHRFAAGVMSVGISNNISKWGTSDIPEELYHVHARKRIWDDYQSYLESSPIYYVDNAQTPLLIMHGKEDTRVHPGQSFELHRHIKTRTETPVRLVLYPGEGHGNRKATARFDFNLRMMRWFNQYLKGENEMPGSELKLEEISIE